MLHFLELRDFLEILTAKKKFGGRIRVPIWVNFFKCRQILQHYE